MIEYIPTNIYIKNNNLYLDTNKGTFKINVPENLQQLKKDLAAMHNLKSD